MSTLETLAIVAAVHAVVFLSNHLSRRVALRSAADPRRG